MDEDAVLSFVRSSLKSAWSLELLLLLQRDPRQVWPADALVRELRGSAQLVEESLASLSATGLVAITVAGARYQPKSADLADLVGALVALYRDRPITILRTIFDAPSDKIRSFSEAFLFRKKTDP